MTKDQIISRIVEIMPTIGRGLSQNEIEEKLQDTDVSILDAQLDNLEQLLKRGSGIRATNVIADETRDQQLADIRKQRLAILDRMAESIRQVSVEMEEEKEPTYKTPISVRSSEKTKFSVASEELANLRANLDDLIARIPTLSDAELEEAKEKLMAKIASTKEAAKATEGNAKVATYIPRTSS